MWPWKNRRPAADRLEQASRLGDDSFELWAALAAAYEKTGRLEESIASLKKAVARNPGNWELRFSLASALFEQGEDESCLGELRRWPESEKNTEYFNLVGAANARLGQVVEAGQAFERAIQLQPGNLESYYNLGLLLLRADAYDEAIAVLDQSLARDSRVSAVAEGVGIRSAAQREVRGGSANIFKIGRDPAFRQLRLLLSRQFIPGSRTAGGGTLEFREGAPAFPGGRAHLLSSGSDPLPAGRGRSRIWSCSIDASNFDPAFAHALFQRAKILFTRGDLAGSLRDSRRAMEIDPGFPQAHFQAAQVLARLGRREEAQARLKTYRELQSKNVDKEFRIFKP